MVECVGLMFVEEVAQEGGRRGEVVAMWQKQHTEEKVTGKETRKRNWGRRANKEARTRGKEGERERRGGTPAPVASTAWWRVGKQDAMVAPAILAEAKRWFCWEGD